MKADVNRVKRGPKPDPEVAARRAEVFDLIDQGWTTRQIAEHQGRKVYQVDKDISRGAKQVLDGDGVVKRYIYMQLARLEAMWTALCADATNPRSKRRDSAIREAVKLFERQAKLLGLDAREAAEIMAIRTGLEKGGSIVDQWVKQSVEGGGFDDDLELEDLGEPIIDEDEDLSVPSLAAAEEELDEKDQHLRIEEAADAAFMAGAAASAASRPRAKNRRSKDD